MLTGETEYPVTVTATALGVYRGADLRAGDVPPLVSVQKMYTTARTWIPLACNHWSISVRRLYITCTNFVR